MLISALNCHNIPSVFMKCFTKSVKIFMKNKIISWKEINIFMKRDNFSWNKMNISWSKIDILVLDFNIQSKIPFSGFDRVKWSMIDEENWAFKSFFYCLRYHYIVRLSIRASLYFLAIELYFMATRCSP